MKLEYMHEIFSKMPVIETERLVLRPMRIFDAFDMYEYSKMPQTTTYLTWSPHPDLEYTKNYLSFVINKCKQGEFHDWAVTLKSEDYKMIGTCGFSKVDLPNNVAELGYVINPKYHRNGYAPEAAKAILDFGFSRLNFHRIEAKYILGNDASVAVMKKCGMTYEGTLRGGMFIKGKYCDIGICSILENEFKRSR